MNIIELPTGAISAIKADKNALRKLGYLSRLEKEIWNITLKLLEVQIERGLRPFGTHINSSIPIAPYQEAIHAISRFACRHPEAAKQLRRKILGIDNLAINESLCKSIVQVIDQSLNSTPEKPMRSTRHSCHELEEYTTTSLLMGSGARTLVVHSGQIIATQAHNYTCEPTVTTQALPWSTTVLPLGMYISLVPRQDHVLLRKNNRKVICPETTEIRPLRISAFAWGLPLILHIQKGENEWGTSFPVLRCDDGLDGFTLDSIKNVTPRQTKLKVDMSYIISQTNQS